jgi:acetylornithine deacetylase/succinyl-diaminopimelate desuccinylase-like protein
MNWRDLSERAMAATSVDRVADLCSQLVSIPSATGSEAPLARFIAELLRGWGIDSGVQAIDRHQASAWGRIRSRTGGGPTLLLYSPIDTLTTGPHSDTQNDSAVSHPAAKTELVCGEGAMNPKGHAATILAAAEAIVRSDTNLLGDVLLGFGAGGMPTNAVSNHGDGRSNLGHGVGCGYLLERGLWPDAAVIAKSGWTVSSEEVGLAWCEVSVVGEPGYVGARHRLPYMNPIARASELVLAIEAWAPEYSSRNSAGSLEPQLIVGSIDSHSARSLAFVPPRCRFGVDMRLSPHVSPLDARRQLEEMLRQRCLSGPETGVTVELCAAIPGTRTPPEHWIVRSTIAAWEAVTGKSMPRPTSLSGATDANILRGRGIPTARVGLPKVALDGRELDFVAGMNTVDPKAMFDLVGLLVNLTARTCSTPLAELIAS